MSADRRQEVYCANNVNDGNHAKSEKRGAEGEEGNITAAGYCLRPGQVVIADNLSAHKVDGVRERIETTGATPLYLLSCSPDFNPVEKAWSKTKQHLRKAKARTLEWLQQAVAETLQSVTAEDAFGCFHHGGYAIYEL